MDIVEVIGKYGFPIIAACGTSYLIYYVWKWVTMEIKPVLKNTEKVTIDLVDRIRLLDNDLIRLNEKVDTISQIKVRNDEEGK